MTLNDRMDVLGSPVSRGLPDLSSPPELPAAQATSGRAMIFIGPIMLQLNKHNLSATPKVKARQYIRVPPLYCQSVIALLVL